MLNLFLWIVALLYGVLGIYYMVKPGPAAALGGVKGGPVGLTDIRATYGGVQIGFALFLIWATFATDRYQAALMSLVMVLGAVAAGRALGLVLDRAPTRFHWIGLVLEIVIVVIALLFLFG